MFVSCANQSENSKVATLYYPTPTPEAKTQTLLETSNSESLVVASSPTETKSDSSPAPLPSLAALPSPSPVESIPPPGDEPPADSSAKAVVTTSTATLMIPVVGIRREDLRDTFKDARSENRVHDAIDIMAPHNAPVVAAVDGEIARFFDSERGGLTVYQFSADKKLIYYYAHLDRRADNLREKEFVKQGTLLGFVGDTGNAGAGNYHLHFAIWTVDDPKRYWDGTNINPYPLLREAKIGVQAQ